jgi:hypothetical protein
VHVYEHFVAALDADGDVADCGVRAGDTAPERVRYIEWRGIANTVHLFDTFAGFPDDITPAEHALSTWPGLKPRGIRVG